MKKIFSWIKNHREISLYIFFGGLTTIVSFLSYYLFRLVFNSSDQSLNSTSIPVVLSWICSVTFAFATNKIWVFKSKNKYFTEFLNELLKFYSGRLLTLFLEMAIMFFFIDLASVDNMIYELSVKFGANVLILVLNYVISKVFVFKKKPKSTKNSTKSLDKQ